MRNFYRRDGGLLCDACAGNGDSPGRSCGAETTARRQGIERRRRGNCLGKVKRTLSGYSLAACFVRLEILADVWSLLCGQFHGRRSSQCHMSQTHWINSKSNYNSLFAAENFNCRIYIDNSFPCLNLNSTTRAKCLGGATIAIGDTGKRSGRRRCSGWKHIIQQTPNSGSVLA